MAPPNCVLSWATSKTPRWTFARLKASGQFAKSLCHLADAEVIYADRMKRVIAEDNPTLFDADPNVHVPALVSATRTAESELAVIEAVRQQMHAILQNCDIEDYQRTAVHSVDGPMTLETLLERITGHIPHHISFHRREAESDVESALTIENVTEN